MEKIPNYSESNICKMFGYVYPIVCFFPMHYSSFPPKIQTTKNEQRLILIDLIIGVYTSIIFHK